MSPPVAGRPVFTRPQIKVFGRREAAPERHPGAECEGARGHSISVSCMGSRRAPTLEHEPQRVHRRRRKSRAPRRRTRPRRARPKTARDGRQSRRTEGERAAWSGRVDSLPEHRRHPLENDGPLPGASTASPRERSTVARRVAGTPRKRSTVPRSMAGIAQRTVDRFPGNGRHRPKNGRPFERGASVNRVQRSIDKDGARGLPKATVDRSGRDGRGPRTNGRPLSEGWSVILLQRSTVPGGRSVVLAQHSSLPGRRRRAFS